MESNKHNIENFERFLRDKTDEFRMYPSKRVWYSIYNNMHPGNRLPSVSMSIILTGFLFLIGYLNTNNVSKQAAAESVLSANKATAAKTLVASNRQQPVVYPEQLTSGSTSVTIPTAITFPGESGNNSQKAANTHSPKRITTGVVRNVTIVTSNIYDEAEQHTPDNAIVLTTNNTPSPVTTAMSNRGERDDHSVADNKSVVLPTSGAIANEASVTIQADNITTQNVLLTATADNIKMIESPVSPLHAKEENDDVKTKAESKAGVAVKSDKNIGLSLVDKAWMEDFAMHNKAAKKWRGKLSLQAYVTPSVVYRNLKNNAAGKPITGNTNNYNAFDINDAVIHKPSFGLETGVSLQYAVAKRLKLKAGIQANYTRYNALAYETNHPIATSITMNNKADNYIYETFKTSIYSNATGLSHAKLHNETYQLSLPIGADFKLMSLDNISWYAGATIQPTLVVYGRSYIISTDRRSYVQDPSLLNRFNLNAGFETYISYKTASGYTWQLGPQYRTQLFSTNTKLYSIEERLQNFGFKIGVTKEL